MQRKNKLSAEDIELFRRAAGPVNPLRPGNRANLAAKRNIPVPAPQQAQWDQTDPVEVFSDFEPNLPDAGDALSYLRPGVQRAQLRKMRKGVYAIRSELDLHGMTVAEARQQVAIFLQESRRRGERCVRIIHGKGYHSRNQPPVLKGKLNAWLRQSAAVLAFCSAPMAGGGTGALYVLLQTMR